MKKNIHPQLNQVTIRCRCGRAPFTIVSSMKQTTFNTENCLNCLPMNTGIYKTKQDGDSARERLFKNLNISDLEDTAHKGE